MLGNQDKGREKEKNKEKEQEQERESNRNNFVSKKKFFEEDTMSTSQSSSDSIARTNVLLD